MTTRATLVLQAINELSREPFAYGACDCCLFAARVIGHVTGRDMTFGHKNYTEAEAEAVLARAGGLRAFVTNLLGPEADKMATEDGDPLLMHIMTVGKDGHAAPQDTIGVRTGDYAAYKTRRGVGRLPLELDAVLCGWRVN